MSLKRKTATGSGADEGVERVHVTLDPQRLEKIDDYRFGSRIGTRSAAMRDLVDAGLEARTKRSVVVVRRVETGETAKGGIIIPDTAKEKPQEGEIVAVGSGARDETGKLVPLDVKAGDRVLFGKWSGTEVKLNGEDLLIMKESDIMGIIG